MYDSPGVVPGQALFDPPPPKEPKSPALDRSNWSRRQTSAGENYTTNRRKNKAKAKKAAVTRERNRSRSRASTTREDSPHATAGSSQPAESQPANAASQPAGESLPPLPLSQLPETQTQSHTVSRTQLCNDLAPFVGFNPRGRPDQEIVDIYNRVREEHLTRSATQDSTNRTLSTELSAAPVLHDNTPASPAPTNHWTNHPSARAPTSKADTIARLGLDPNCPLAKAIENYAPNSTPAARHPFMWASGVAPNGSMPPSNLLGWHSVNPGGHGALQSPSSGSNGGNLHARPASSSPSLGSNDRGPVDQPPVPGPGLPSIQPQYLRALSPVQTNANPADGTATQDDSGSDEAIQPPPIKRSRGRKRRRAVTALPPSRPDTATEPEAEAIGPLPETLQLRYPTDKVPPHPGHQSTDDTTEVIPETDPEILAGRTTSAVHPTLASLSLPSQRRTYAGSRSHVRSGNPLDRTSVPNKSSWREGAQTHAINNPLPTPTS
ncbi:hypothetical protein FRC12_013886 [Ceratobasidium sp. 428]|nr:hypothetical protein FRC12_013886 [Ceratobasidium sp. 428]